MCVGLPAKVMTMKDGMAVVDASGAKREVSAELIENLEPGDYVMVHAGIAIAKITEEDEDEAEESSGGVTMKEQLKKAKAIIEGYDGPAVRVMEVCGTHTHEIFHLRRQNLSHTKMKNLMGMCSTHFHHTDSRTIIAFNNCFCFF